MAQPFRVMIYHLLLKVYEEVDDYKGCSEATIIGSFASFESNQDEHDFNSIWERIIKWQAYTNVCLFGEYLLMYDSTVHWWAV